jgi:hypothetical protein
VNTSPQPGQARDAGPFATRRQADTAVADILGDRGRWDILARNLLAGALAAAGVELGGYDETVTEWLSRFEPATVAVIAGWVTRAAAGGDR